MPLPPSNFPLGPNRGTEELLPPERCDPTNAGGHKMDISAFAWPSAAVVMGLGFMGMFRPNIGRLLDRSRKVSVPGFSADLDSEHVLESQSAPKTSTALPSPPTTALPAPTGNDKVHGNIVAHAPPRVDAFAYYESEARELLDNVPDPEHKLAWALRFYAVARHDAEFEGIYRQIFGSQIKALRSINHSQPWTDEQLRPFYDEAASLYPKAYEAFSFEQWREFMFTTLMITQPDTETGLFGITVRGRDFLGWLISRGIREDKLW